MIVRGYVLSDTILEPHLTEIHKTWKFLKNRELKEKCLGISNYSSWGGGGRDRGVWGHMVSTANKEGGIVRIVQNLTRELGKFYSDTTKLLQDDDK